MSAHLESLVANASARETSWTPERARRVRLGVARRQENKRLVRRAVVVVGGACVLLFALLRGASSAPLTSADPPLASRDLGDAGYVHD